MADSISTHAQAVYESFDGFLKHSIKEYYSRRGKTHPLEFAALLAASGQTLSLGLDTIREGSVGKKLAVGAAGAVALRMGLKYALGGPIGIIATGLGAASAGRYLVKNQDKLGRSMRRFKAQIADVRSKYEEIAASYSRGRFTSQERNLLVDGLSARFLQDLLAAPPEDAAVTAPPSEPASGE